MSAPLFASLTAGMLARKGEAQPSKEPSFGHKPWQPPVTPASIPVPEPGPAPQRVRAVASLDQERTDTGIESMKVKLNEVAQTWPAPKPSEPTDDDGSAWVPNRQQTPLNLGSLGAAFKTTIRLTHAQARAVKLAALILDKPQQEILTAGLVERLQALACADLSKCSCFQAVIEGIKLPEAQQGETASPV